MKEELESLVVKWHQRQIEYQDLAEKHKDNPHTHSKCVYKALATRDCWKELLTLIQEHDE